MMDLLIIEGDFTFLLYLILLIMFGPPLLFWLIGYNVRKKNPKASKIFYIIAAVYLVLGLGICGSMMLM